MVEISKSKVKSDDLLESLRLLHYSDKNRFVSEFDKISMFDFDTDPEKALKVLSDLSSSGNDLKGVVVVDSKPVVFSVKDVVGLIKVRKSEFCKNLGTLFQIK